MPAARAFCARRAISSSIFLPTTIIRSASSSMTTTMNGSALERLGLARASSAERVRMRLAASRPPRSILLVVAGQVAHAELAHQLVAPLHLADAPVQRVGRLLHVGDDRREQVRDALVDRQLEHLRVDQDQAHVARLGLVEQRQDHRVDADRLARAGGAGDQQVRHLARGRRRPGCRRCPCRAPSVSGECSVVVGLRAEDLGQADHLRAWRSGSSSAMYVLPGIVSTTRIDDQPTASAPGPWRG